MEPTSFAQTDVELLKATICGPKTSKACGTCMFIIIHCHQIMVAYIYGLLFEEYVDINYYKQERNLVFLVFRPWKEAACPSE